jgi:hypothetical protein
LHYKRFELGRFAIVSIAGDALPSASDVAVCRSVFLDEWADRELQCFGDRDFCISGYGFLAKWARLCSGLGIGEGWEWVDAVRR